MSDTFDFTGKVADGTEVLGDLTGLNVFKVTGSEDLKKLEGIYDVIICDNLIHTFVRSTEAVKKMAEHLDEGGRLYLSTPLMYGDNGGSGTVGFKDWKQKKAIYWVDKYFIREGNVYKKTNYRFLLVYKFHPHNTGAFIEKAMSKIVKVANAEKLGASVNGEGIKSICEKLDITHLLFIDSGMRLIVPKGLKCKTLSYSIDTFLHTENTYRYLKQFDFVFFAQKRFAVENNHFFLPLGVDTDIYRPLRCRKKYDVSFCGTVLVDDLHKERNDYLRMLANNVSFYWGKDSNEWANLRYNEAHFIFNCGISSDLNMRVFEAMATGVPLLMNEVDNMDDYFTDGVDYIKYDKDNLKSQFEKYSNDPDKLLEIGKNAIEKIRNGHTYIHRVKDLLKIIVDNKIK